VGKLRRRKREQQEEEEGRIGSTPTQTTLFIEEPTGSARCGSFYRTTHFNGSILRNSREDCGGFIANRVSHDLNSKFRSSTVTKLSSGHPDGKQVRQAPAH
jgi:hypothetical protein